jgi:uncharacterized coiled-coil protein SlyX
LADPRVSDLESRITAMEGRVLRIPDELRSEFNGLAESQKAALAEVERSVTAQEEKLGKDLRELVSNLEEKFATAESTAMQRKTAADRHFQPFSRATSPA